MTARWPRAMRVAVVGFTFGALTLGQAGCGRYGPPVRNAPQSEPKETASAAEANPSAQDDADRRKKKP